MSSIKTPVAEGNLNNNAYSNMASRGLATTSQKDETESTGSRRAYAAFYGLPTDQVTKSSYARIKQTMAQSLPKKVKSSAFDYGRSRSKINSREDRLRNPHLYNAGSAIIDSESKAFKRAQKQFYLLPSASSVNSRRPVSHQSNIDQNQHLSEIRGLDPQFEKDKNMFYAGFTPVPGAPKTGRFENYKHDDEEKPATRKISSSASFKDAQRRFFGIDSKVSSILM